MGFLICGIDYDMIGRVGNHVGRKVKGRNVLSMRPSKSNKPPTELQLEHREKLRIVVQWLSRLSGVINEGFKDYDAAMSQMNAAVSLNLKKAVTAVAPFDIDYGKVVLSKGKLDMPPQDPAIDTVTAAKLDYSWVMNTGITNAKGTDKVNFVVYNKVKDKFVILRGGAIRSALAYSLQLPANFSGDHVQCYISFVSANGKLVSNSYFVGDHIVV